MIEENNQENQDQVINSDNNYSKQNFVNQIDDIINKYKTQLEHLKTNTNQKIKEYHLDERPMITSSNLKSKTFSPNIGLQNLINENIQKNEPDQFSPDLTQEIQNDNIKLQSALTAEKLNVVKLNSQIEKYEIELNKSKQQIIELQNQLTIKENDFINQLNNITNDINKIKNENNINMNIIENFFALFNKNIDLFNKSKIISCDKNTQILYLKNDYEGNNEKLSIFVVKSLDILINKLLLDNKELYEQLIETKKILDEQNNIQKEIDRMKDIKEENIILKEQLQNLLKENEIFKNENLKLQKNLIELRNYLNNMNNLNSNNNNHNHNEQINIFHGNNRNNYFNNYKRQRINSYNEHNHNKNNYNVINHNEKTLKNIKDSYNSTRNIKSNLGFKSPMNNNNNNNNNSSINNNNYSLNNNYTNNNNNYNEQSYCKTDENRKININELNNENNNNFNKTYDFSNENEKEKIVSTGFERPIEQLKKKIMLLEQQIKNSPQQ